MVLDGTCVYVGAKKLHEDKNNKNTGQNYSKYGTNQMKFWEKTIIVFYLLLNRPRGKPVGITKILKYCSQLKRLNTLNAEPSCEEKN